MKRRDVLKSAGTGALAMSTVAKAQTGAVRGRAPDDLITRVSFDAGAGDWVTWGLPLRKGHLAPAELQRLSLGDGIRVQTDNLTLWPDGSVHWCACTAKLPGNYARGTPLVLRLAPRPWPRERNVAADLGEPFEVQFSEYTPALWLIAYPPGAKVGDQFSLTISSGSTVERFAFTLARGNDDLGDVHAHHPSMAKSLFSWLLQSRLCRSAETTVDHVDSFAFAGTRWGRLVSTGYELSDGELEARHDHQWRKILLYSAPPAFGEAPREFTVSVEVAKAEGSAWRAYAKRLAEARPASQFTARWRDLAPRDHWLEGPLAIQPWREGRPSDGEGKEHPCLSVKMGATLSVDGRVSDHQVQVFNADMFNSSIRDSWYAARVVVAGKVVESFPGRPHPVGCAWSFPRAPETIGMVERDHLFATKIIGRFETKSRSAAEADSFWQMQFFGRMPADRRSAGEPLRPGQIDLGVGTAGGGFYQGWINGWDAHAIADWTPAAVRYLSMIHTNVLGCYQMFYNDETGIGPRRFAHVDPYEKPDAQHVRAPWQGKRSDAGPDDVKWVKGPLRSVHLSGFALKHSHGFQAGVLPYLLTGRRWFRDILPLTPIASHQYGYGGFKVEIAVDGNGDHSPSGTRFVPWPKFAPNGVVLYMGDGNGSRQRWNHLRNVGWAMLLTPESHPDKTLWRRIVRNNAWVNELLLPQFGTGYVVENAGIDFPSRTQRIPEPRVNLSGVYAAPQNWQQHFGWANVGTLVVAGVEEFRPVAELMAAGAAEALRAWGPDRVWMLGCRLSVHRDPRLPRGTPTLRSWKEIVALFYDSNVPPLGELGAARKENKLESTVSSSGQAHSYPGFCHAALRALSLATANADTAALLRDGADRLYEIHREKRDRWMPQLRLLS